MRRVAIPLVLLVACTGADRAGFAVRDSAGVTIAESTRPAWPEGGGWRLAAEPEQQIGVVEGDSAYQFFRLVAARFLSDGRIAVADYGTSALRVYRPDGTFDREIGREGEAPGEFRGVLSVEVGRGDTLVAADYRLQRVTRFDADGGLVDVVRTLMPGHEPMGPVHVLADGRYLVVPSWSSAQLGPNPRQGVVRQPAPLLVFGADGALQDTLGMFPGMEIEVIITGERMTMGAVTFGRTLAAAVHGNDVYVGTGDDLEVSVFSPDGTLRRIVRVPDADLSVTAADVQSVRDRMLAQLATPEQRASLERLFAQSVTPARRAAYNDIRVDDEGNLWTSGSETVGFTFGPWNVFDSAGRWLGGFSFPEGFRPYDIRGGRVLGRWRDDANVEYLRVYRLEKN